MKWFESISTKVMLLILTMVVLTVMLTVFVFLNRLTLLQHEAVHSFLKNTYQQMDFTLQDMNDRLVEVSNLIIRDDKIQAGVNLIANYQDVNDYQPLVFNPPKEEIAEEIKRYASNAGLQMAVIYNQYLPEIFYIPSDVGQVGGYFQFEDSQPLMVYQRETQQKTLRPPHLPQIPTDKNRIKKMIGPHIDTLENGTIVYETLVQMDESNKEDKENHQWLRLGYVIDQRMLNDMSQRLGVGMILTSRDTELRSSNLSNFPSIGSIFSDAQKVMHDGGNEDQLAWDHFSYENVSYTRGVVQLQGVGEKITLSLIKKTESLDFGIQAIRQTFLWIVPVMVIILIIIGKIFADKVILKPVKKLTKLSSDLASGNFERDEGFKTGGEFGLLVETFNLMSRKIQERESDLINAQIRMTDIIENAPSIIYMKDVQGHYLVANTNFLELVGKSLEETLGSTDFDHFPEDVASKIRENDQMVNRIGVPIDFEEALPQQDGSVKFYHSVKFPIQDSEGKTVSFCGISTDITDRKRIENSLKLSRMVIEQINEAIVITDLQGKIIDANKAYEKLTGYEKHELIGHNPNIVKSGEHDKEYYAILWDELIKNGFWRNKVIDKTKNGETFSAWMAISTVHDTLGKPAYYVATYSQIDLKQDA